jgi:xylulokinase
MLLLGIDLGTSSAKVSVVDAATQRAIISVSYPEGEREIKSLHTGWAEQYPLQWWQDIKLAILKANSSGLYNPKDIGAIGIAYQMHGLVLVDKAGELLRDSIIWCDSRAIPYGDAANLAIGPDRCLQHLLNSPGNFTAAKLAWVKENEPEVYDRVDKFMLPGDYVAMQLTGECTATVSMLSEGIFWDFRENRVSTDVMQYFGFDERMIPPVHPVFSGHGGLLRHIAHELDLTAGIPVSYKAGDQPNNALSLGVLKPGEVATTAGTSGVIYTVTDQLFYDDLSRVNTFAHVNHTAAKPRLGVLLCINGAGIANRWIRNTMSAELSYSEIDRRALDIPVGSEGLFFLPFGNGAERMLGNMQPGAQFCNLDLNRHTASHLFRAVHEGVAFAHRYGLDIMRDACLSPSVAKAGHANMFLNKTFTHAFVNSTGLAIELYKTEGSIGAALGAGIGAKVYSSEEEAVAGLERLSIVTPDNSQSAFNEAYDCWKEQLELQLSNHSALQLT